MTNINIFKKSADAVGSVTDHTTKIEQQLAADLLVLDNSNPQQLISERFELYVEATRRAATVRALMPDLPEILMRDYVTATQKRLPIPLEVEAAATRFLIKELAADGHMNAVRMMGAAHTILKA